MFFILRKVGYREIIYIFNSIGAFAFFTGIFFYILSLFLEVLIFKKLTVWSSGKNLKLPALFLDFSRAVAFSAYTPSSSGYLLMIKLLNFRGLKIGDSSASLFIYKILNYSAILILAFLGTVIILKDPPYIWVSMFLIFIIATLFLAAVNEKAGERVKKVAGEKINRKFSGFSNSVKKILKNKKYIMHIATLKFLNRLFIALVLYIVFILNGAAVSFIQVLLLSNIIDIISTLPVTIGGFGIREGGAILIFSYLGVGAGLTVSTYLFFYMVKYLSISVVLIIFTKKYGI